MLLKIDLQFFGGRGASSGGNSATGGGGGGSGKELGLAGQTYFENGNKVSVAGTLNYWEGKSKNLKHEELLFVGEDGFAAGYFKGGSGAVSFHIPEGVDASKTVLTHNHPTGGKDGRTIGGSFSNADLTNHIRLGLKESRATSVEGTYYFRAGKKADAKGFQKAMGTRKSAVNKATKKRMDSGDKKSEIDIYLEESHKWYSKNAKKYGFEYGLIKSK